MARASVERSRPATGPTAAARRPIARLKRRSYRDPRGLAAVWWRSAIGAAVVLAAAVVGAAAGRWPASFDGWPGHGPGDHCQRDGADGALATDVEVGPGLGAAHAVDDPALGEADRDHVGERVMHARPGRRRTRALLAAGQQARQRDRSSTAPLVVGEVERELEVLDLDRTEIPLDPVPLALATYTLRRRRPLDPASPIGGARIQGRMATALREPRAGARARWGADAVNARACTGMRRQLEYRHAERVDRRRFVAGLPSRRWM